MKMKKSLKMVIVSLIILTSLNVYAMTREEFIGIYEARIIEHCENENARWENFRHNDMARRMLQIPWQYECGLLQFYAIRKNVQHQIDMGGDEEAWEVFGSLMDENYIEEFDTYNFMAVNIAYEKWLEEAR